MATPHESTVLKAAIVSRLLLLSLIFLWRSFLYPYDTSAPLNPPCLSSPLSSPPSPYFPRVATAIESSVVWDAVYFVRIAQCGYEYEQTYAFLPLLPICISFFSRTVFAPLVPLIGHRAVLALSGYMINNFVFVFAALYLYRLSFIILKDTEAALRASLLFCFNPASIFYSSIYTESLYALFSLGGLYYLMSGSHNTAVLWLALSGSARSNGVLNAGYFGFLSMHRAYNALFVKKRIYLVVQVLIVGGLQCVCVFIPFIAFQAYGYHNICLRHSQDEMRPWCKATVPLLYNFIQSHYWGVGFLRYFQIKQLPNFLLASPILSLAFCTIFSYVKLQPELFFSLGFQTLVPPKNSIAGHLSSEATPRARGAFHSDKSSSKRPDNFSLKRRQKIPKEENPNVISLESDIPQIPGYTSSIIVPFILHLGFMVATALFVMHVQVATRFLSASPPLYWYASYLLAYPRKKMTWGYIIKLYSSAYILLGSLLFSNFYPFT